MPETTETLFMPKVREFADRFIETHEFAIDPCTTNGLFLRSLIVCRNKDTGEVFTLFTPEPVNANTIEDAIRTIIDSVGLTINKLQDMLGHVPDRLTNKTLESVCKGHRPILRYARHVTTLRTLREHVSEADSALLFG
jgi:hypothetical protein